MSRRKDPTTIPVLDQSDIAHDFEPWKMSQLSDAGSQLQVLVTLLVQHAMESERVTRELEQRRFSDMCLHVNGHIQPPKFETKAWNYCRQSNQRGQSTMQSVLCRSLDINRKEQVPTFGSVKVCSHDCQTDDQTQERFTVLLHVIAVHCAVQHVWAC